MKLNKEQKELLIEILENSLNKLDMENMGEIKKIEDIIIQIKADLKK